MYVCLCRPGRKFIDTSLGVSGIDRCLCGYTLSYYNGGVIAEYPGQYAVACDCSYAFVLLRCKLTSFGLFLAFVIRALISINPPNVLLLQSALYFACWATRSGSLPLIKATDSRYIIRLPRHQISVFSCE